MKALVINLNSAIDRMAFQKQQLKSLGIKFQRLPAFKINNTQDKTYQDYYSTWQRPMTISEVSCFFSHKKAWDQIIEQNQPMLVLEDDAWLADNVSMVLDKLEKLSDLDYVTFEVTGSNSRKLIAKEAVDNFHDINLMRLYQGRSGAGAYVLWPSGARKLIKKTEKGNIGLADKFINANYSLRSYQIEPAIAIQLDQCHFFDIKPPLEVRTSISTKTNTSSKPIHFIQYKIKRTIGEIKAGINLFRNKHHATRRRITLSEYFKDPGHRSISLNTSN